MKKKRDPLQNSIEILEEGKLAVESAESELQKALAEISKVPRAQKISVSTAIESALVKLQRARAAVIDAEKTIEEARRG